MRKRGIVTALLLGATFMGIGINDSVMANTNYGMPKQVAKVQQKEFGLKRFHIPKVQNKLAVNKNIAAISTGGVLNIADGVAEKSSADESSHAELD